MADDKSIFTIAIGDLDPADIHVSSINGREALSANFVFDITASTTKVHEDAVETAFLGQPALLTIRAGGAERTYRGIIGAVASQGRRVASKKDDSDDASQQYRLRLVPHLWILKQTRRTRIFQNKTVNEVVDSVLGAFGIPTRWQLTRTYPAREYCTQYEESDYHFVRRLLAESGIFFYFDPGGASDSEATVVLGDSVAAYGSIDAGPDGDDGGSSPTLHHLPGEMQRAKEDQIPRFEPLRAIKPKVGVYREYDATRPRALLTSDTTGATPPAIPSVDVPDVPDIPVPAVSNGQATLEIYEHHGNYRVPDWSYAAAEADLVLRQRTRRAKIAGGTSFSARLTPGKRFTLDDQVDTWSGEYVVTEVRHQGTLATSHEHHGDKKPTLYENSFECVAADVVFTPKARKRKFVQVCLTATVVGPAGEDIHVDAAGQIKVQFHWDREGGMNDQSSCWIRTMQTWAGASFGVQFIPRVGMEVVVTFDGGDPDKPLVLGCVHNGSHPTTFKLPNQKTKSGLRTQTTPGAGGFNELSFEDSSGGEQVYLHAQRDWDTLVERNLTKRVRGSETLEVGGDSSGHVSGDIGSQIDGNDTLDVGKDRTRRVGGNDLLAVKGNGDVRVTGNRTTRVEENDRHEVKKRLDLTVNDDFTTRVKGCSTVLVGKNDAPRSHTMYVEGVTQLYSTGITEIISEKSLVLRVGKSELKITADKIEMNSPAIAAKGAGAGISAADDKLDISAKKDATVTCKKMTVKSDQASISLEKEVKIDGQKILLNSPDEATDKPPEKPGPPTKIELKDQNGKPLAYQRYLIVLDDGSEVSGMLDKDGKIELDLVAGSGKITFPDLKDAKAG